MEQKALVVGVKKFKGDVEGNHYDSCKVRVLMQVSDTGNEAGLNVVELAYGDSSNFTVLSKMNFPVMCDLDIEFQLKNGRPVMTLLAIEPSVN